MKKFVKNMVEFGGRKLEKRPDNGLNELMLWEGTVRSFAETAYNNALIKLNKMCGTQVHLLTYTEILQKKVNRMAKGLKEKMTETSI